MGDLLRWRARAGLGATRSPLRSPRLARSPLGPWRSKLQYAETGGQRPTPRTFLGLAILLAGALGLRLWGLGYPIWYDEGFHILAARSWLQDGVFCIGECPFPYDRGALFTRAVAIFFALFGESPEAARMPSVLAGTLLVAAVFAWVRKEVSPRAAWISAGLCAIAPELIGWSQVSRFYSAQALFVWCGAGLFYSALHSATRRKVALGLAGSALCFVIALRLQITTLIAGAAVGTWFAGWLVAHRTAVSRRVQVTVAASLVIVGLAAAVLEWSTLAAMWQEYRGASNLILAPDAANPFFYHAWFIRMYSYLYALLPLAILVAVALRPRPALFLVAVFAVSLAVHSFGAFKGDRFVLYAYPFFFSVWGLALSEVGPLAYGYARDAASRFLPSGSPGIRWLAPVAFAAAVAFAGINLEAVQTTLRLLVVSNTEWSSEPWYRGHTDWEALRPTLEPLVEDVAVVGSSAQIKTLYYFGRTDLAISRTGLYRAVTPDGPVFRPEFWRDTYTGKPVMSTPASVERLVSCYPSGLFLIESGHWRLPSVVTPEAADTIERLMERVDVDPGMRALVFLWRTEEEALSPDCGGRLDEWATS